MQYVYCKLAVREVATLESLHDLNFRWTLTTENRPYFFVSLKLSTEQSKALKNDFENHDYVIFGA